MSNRNPGQGRARLVELLDLRNQHPERLETIDAEIRAAFAETHAVFVLDMAGFSRLVQRYGTTHYLAMIRRLHLMALPMVAAQGGRVVKTEADNVFAVFPGVGAALVCARELNESLKRANRYLPDDWDIHVGIGIGWGEVLMVDGMDLFGHEMNLASKLGEDVACPGEILLTEAAFAALDTVEPSHVEEARIGALAVRFHRVRA
jgi:class 3 adenylate cyclase